MPYCYIIYSGNTTYNGYTTDIKRRLRQHNGELVGGARSTRKHKDWKYLAIITCPSYDKSSAMALEWSIRYPTRRKPRPKEFSGVIGRLQSLKLIQVPHDGQLYVADEFIPHVDPMKGPLPLSQFFSADVQS